jgi:hypothetical protein
MPAIAQAYEFIGYAQAFRMLLPSANIILSRYVYFDESDSPASDKHVELLPPWIYTDLPTALVLSLRGTIPFSNDHTYQSTIQP